jgi:wyosine [tRNA(Phe)-imidazoG37] synthetase (radical SAM superfamily)
VNFIEKKISPADYSLAFWVADFSHLIISGNAYRSATSKLTMENVPWHADVKEFSEVLASKSGGIYELACEHVHSCCVLLAKVDKFKINGKWHTWIDYDRFNELVSFLQHN